MMNSDKFKLVKVTVPGESLKYPDAYYTTPVSVAWLNAAVKTGGPIYTRRVKKVK